MNLYRLVRPVLHLVSPEAAHDLSLAALAWGLGPRFQAPEDPALAVTLWGKRFANPLGLAAGFDKNARVIGPMMDLGFGFVEVGTITPRPQPGNPKPRLFRLDEDHGIINRLGFNSAGAEACAARLETWRRGGRPGILGVNIGKNKQSLDAAADYGEGARRLGAYADYLVVNVSSPNTPGLRDLQAAAELDELLDAVAEALSGLDHPPPVVVKISPDLSDQALGDITALAAAGRMDGLMIANTTTDRPQGLRGRDRFEEGGLSGRPLFAPATRVLAACWRATVGKVVLIGVGGIGSAEDAYAKIRAGASLVALYSALVFEGPALIPRIVAGLGRLLRDDGFTTISEAVGADHR
ncbi:MAG: quinone-dependent dihydroorotate dehydrogenase [Alphaproteobacteria bacterium]|nr:MAG: quinone-dependent dihydroorotate dehydrogenase [Alphaproteobacteria bacterium]